MKVESMGVLWSQIISVENPLNDSYTPGLLLGLIFAGYVPLGSESP